MMKKILYIVYVAVLIVMGAATFVESAKGTDFVHANVYGAWWFAALWAVLAFVGMIKVVKDFRAFKDIKILLLHASFLIILAGALLSHIYGRSGTIHLRLNEPQDVAAMKHNGIGYLHRLPFTVELKEFDIVEDADGNAIDYKSEFKIGDKNYIVSMNNIATHGNIRFYQMSYDYDGRGSTLMLNRDPYGIPVTYCGYGLLFLSFIWLVFRGNRRSREGRSFRHYRVLVAAFLLTAAWCVYYFVLDGSWSQIPVLRSPLLVFHVVIIIMAYALLLIQAVVSATALIRKSENIVSLLRPALCLLSIGIFLGAIWANISWGNYWSWDSKEVWALITLMIYAVPVHTRSLPAFRQPRTFHIYVLIAFLTVLMTYFGVNYLLTGLHSYN